MDADIFDHLVKRLTATEGDRLRTLAAAVSRRGLLAGLTSGLVAVLPFTLGGEEASAKKKRKKPCAKAGQPTSKKRKRCCAGLDKDVTGRCAESLRPAAGCTPATCPATACGSHPDGCGGMLSCGCPADQICLRSGVCQVCSVTCPSGNPVICGAALQTAMNGGGTIYVCPGRYQGGFVLDPPLATLRVIGAGDGDNQASDTILHAGGPGGAGRVLLNNAGTGLVELERLRITGGIHTPGMTGSAAGISHLGTTLRMTECTISGNTSTSVGPDGGGLWVASVSTLEMTRSTVRDNHATGRGGGIATGGTTTLTDCLVEANTAFGGGGLLVGFGTTTLTGSTRVGGRNVTNINGGGGGGILVEFSTLVIAETCRVTENRALRGSGGGIFNSTGTVILQGADPSPIVVNNCFENCVGTVPKCSTAPPVACPP